MKITTSIKLNLRIQAVKDRVMGAATNALKDVVVDISNEVIKSSPYLSGHNARSIMYEIDKLMAKIYSTSGYGGYLETGTANMPGRPYFKPALDRNIKKLPAGIKAKL